VTAPRRSRAGRYFARSFIGFDLWKASAGSWSASTWEFVVSAGRKVHRNLA
jgi:hypothetical protein